jgi:protein-disulfide isomerase
LSNPSRRGSGPGSTANRRAQAREQARLAAAAARRRRILIQVGVVGAVAVLVIGIITTAALIGRRSASQAGAAPVVDTTVTVGGAQVPFAVDGSAIRLGPADAPARVDLWVDYSCPHCQEYEAANGPVLEQLVARGDVSVSYHNVQFVSRYGATAGSAAACVAVEDPQRWPAFNAALYANHGPQTDGWPTSRFRDFAQSQGISPAALDCIGQDRYTGWITDNTAAAADADVEGTPTLQLNGTTVPTVGGQELVARVDELARG